MNTKNKIMIKLYRYQNKTYTYCINDLLRYLKLNKLQDSFFKR